MQGRGAGALVWGLPPLPCCRTGARHLPESPLYNRWEKHTGQPLSASAALMVFKIGTPNTGMNLKHITLSERRQSQKAT